VKSVRAEHFIRRLVCRAALACLAVACCLISDHALAADDDHAFFEAKVRPLLIARCYECHSGTKTKGGLALDTRAGWLKGGESGAVIVPGKPDESLLIKAISQADPDLAMPPEEGGGKLSSTEIALLTEWVRRGAPDPRVADAQLGGMSRESALAWWAFQPLPDAEPKNVPGTHGPLTPNPSPARGEGSMKLTSGRIDALLDEKIRAAALTPNPPADKRTLIRRATYDLTGLPPTAAEVAAFEADKSPDAFAKLVDRLLASPQYGVHWGRHWLDVVRYADTAGENTDRPLPHAWRYRNWVFDALNRDVPYDRFVRLQLAGDIVAAGGSREEAIEGIVATGYLAIARRFGHDSDKDMYLTYEDVIDNVGKNFLGMTLGCARCHDHKYDPVSSDDYYALYGIFDSSRFAFPGCEPKGQPRDLVPLVTPAELDVRRKPWKAQLALAEQARNRLAETHAGANKQLTERMAQSGRLLAASSVPEKASVAIEDDQHRPLDLVTVRAGEVLQLAVLPNANHGADSTRIEWEIAEIGGASRVWNIADVVPNLTQGNPLPAAHGAAWCFMETTSGTVFLSEHREAVDGHPELKSWSIGSDPSIFVNTSDQEFKVWAGLPARSLFVHPGPKRPVAIAWICPIDGTLRIKGRVSDVHPSGGDGVAFRLEHFASPEVGPLLMRWGQESRVAQLDTTVGPEGVVPVAYAVVEGNVKNARMQQRGEPEKLGAEVPRRWLAVFGGEAVSSESESGRRQLADWIVAHPLALRVIANRLWQWHFGAGLVRSPNDFGARGEQPSHPELLDALAASFRDGGYGLKAMHRLLMLTAAYQRSSARSPALATLDAEDRLLARFARRRLSAEEIRDSLLMVAGHLDLSPGEAHPFPPSNGWKFTQHNPFAAVYESDKRSAFLMVQRQRRHPFLALFDGADPNSSTPARQTTTVPTQALYFMNDPFFHAQAKRFAEALSKLPDDQARITMAYRTVLQREPEAAEREQARRFVAAYPASAAEKWSALARVLLAGNEFLHLD
jgi:hypothetical protein